MTKQEAIEKLKKIEDDCRRMRHSLEQGCDEYCGDSEFLCHTSAVMDSLYEGRVETWEENRKKRGLGEKPAKVVSDG